MKQSIAEENMRYKNLIENKYHDKFNCKQDKSIKVC